MLRRFTIVIITVAVYFAINAQSTVTVAICDTINASGHISIDQPAAVANLLRHTITPTEATDNEGVDARHNTAVQRSGYRVQVFDDNNPRTSRTQAENVHRNMETQFPYLQSYISFNSPYWRVKVGDFRTRAEAEAALEEIRAAFPYLGSYLRVVRDKITVN